MIETGRANEVGSAMKWVVTSMKSKKARYATAITIPITINITAPLCAEEVFCPTRFGLPLAPELAPQAGFTCGYVAGIAPGKAAGDTGAGCMPVACPAKCGGEAGNGVEVPGCLAGITRPGGP